MEKIERRGNVVPSLIPKVGQAEPRNVGKQNDAGEQQEQESIGAGPDRTAFGGVHEGYCTMAFPAEGSRAISPNAVSYWVTFCCRTLSSALACCGLTKMP